MKDFEKINWLPVSEKINQYLCPSAFKFFKETCSLYFHDVYRQSGQSQANKRSSVLKLKHPLKNMSSDQKIIVLSNTNILEQFADAAEVIEFT